MPGIMLHLMFANEVRPNGRPLFFLGNIAPDAVSEWTNKDRTHFRNLDNREPALRALAYKAEGEFAEGVLLHLYFDWKWDTIVRQNFINQIGNDWFKPYRNELALASSYAFHQTHWARPLWDEMDAIPMQQYGITPGATAEEVREFFCQNHKWHIDNRIGPSLFFSPELIKEFINQTADEFVQWRGKQ